jgi:Flp pilus assembly protein TadG
MNRSRTPRRRPARRGERGISIILVALLLIPLLLFAGLATDVGAWYARAAAVQRAADAAALAGVAQLANGEQQAIDEALRVATLNGFTNGVDGVTVTADRLAGTQRIFVEITDTDVDRFLSAPFRSNVRITRRATAEQVLPVPLGSPRNFLGTNQDASIPNAQRENFWLSVSGYCARHEMGDRITTRTDSNGSTFQGCQPGVNGVRSNPEFNTSSPGYFYGVQFTAAGGSHTIQVYDAPHCQYNSPGAAGDSGADESGGASARQYTFRLRRPGPDPTTAAIVSSVTLSPSDCASWGSVWHDLFTITNPAQDEIWYLEIVPVQPADTSGADAAEGQNQMSLRVATGGSFTPCSTDPGIVGYTASCSVNLFGLTHLGVYANAAGSNPSFFLADVGPEHRGKIMEVELFDSAEGAQGIELIPPTTSPGTEPPVTVTWEIACMDGSYRSDNSGSCATSTGEIAPPGGYGPFTATRIDVSGTATTAQRPWGDRNVQDGRFSDRLMRLRYTLPSTYASGSNPQTWWRIRYIVGGSGLGDRTTWTVRIQGDPVRLVPNT